MQHVVKRETLVFLADVNALNLLATVRVTEIVHRRGSALLAVLTAVFCGPLQGSPLESAFIFIIEVKGFLSIWTTLHAVDKVFFLSCRFPHNKLVFPILFEFVTMLSWGLWFRI